jgi:hypothetical protein
MSAKALLGEADHGIRRKIKKRRERETSFIKC